MACPIPQASHKGRIKKKPQRQNRMANPIGRP